MTGVFGFFSILIPMYYGMVTAITILVIYVLVLAIKALKIYIQKNS